MTVAHETFDEIMRQGGAPAVQNAGRFFMKDDPVFHALRSVTDRLRAMGVPYCIAGGMALVAHGYDRTTVDVHILVRDDSLQRIHQQLDGLGYVPRFVGSKNLRDTSSKVRIEFLVTGQLPGDGRPKPVAFPDPIDSGVEIDGIRYLALPKLIELKLASGMTAPHRLKDLADVQELIRVLQLNRELAESLNPYVRDKFIELWTAVAQAPPEE